jgi:hypothetical protein
MRSSSMGLVVHEVVSGDGGWKSLQEGCGWNKRGIRNVRDAHLVKKSLSRRWLLEDGKERE